jgi:spoIIIJ-associated protein
MRIVRDMDAELLTRITTDLFNALGAPIDELRVSSGHRTIIAVSSPDSKTLIGPRGEHLQALNVILRRLVESRAGEGVAGFLLDINEYHEAQMEQVRQGARMLAQRARLFKHDVELSPMNPYERLVVHELFAEDPDIETRSEGEGKFRHIVLKYKATG